MLGTPGTAYTTSKWALRGLSASAACGLCNWGIRSNVICPGFIRNTNLTNTIEAQSGGQNPLANFALVGRSGETMELAQAALFFASDESSYVTGIDMPVDGGLYGAGVYSIMRSKLAMFSGEKE
jgi:3alpha(or 20beta)-hydroxysteroid dehydrogenase